MLASHTKTGSGVSLNVSRMALFALGSLVAAGPDEGWKNAKGSEVAFWEAGIKGVGQSWGRFDKTKEIAHRFRPYLGLPPFAPALQVAVPKALKLVVVGSGPSSDMGYKSWPDANVTLLLTDALGREYANMYKRLNAYPPVMPAPVVGEKLLSHFGDNKVDLSYSVNALDHAYDPAKAIRNMLAIVRPCAWLVFEIWQNVANAEKGRGFHRWNFELNKQSGAVVLTKYGSAESVDISAMLKSKALNPHGVADIVHAITYKGCYLNGDCNGAATSTRIRFSARKQHESFFKRCPGDVGFLNWPS